MKRLLLPAFLVVVAGCGERAATSYNTASSPDVAGPTPVVVPAAGELSSVLLEDVPFVQQKPDFCGEACVEMAAKKLGQKYDQDAVFAASGVDPALGRGAYTKDLAAALYRLGFDPGQVWNTVDAKDPGPGMQALFAKVHADLVRGVPSILCMHYSDRPDTTEHFRLVVGYDAERDEIVYHEPAEEDGGYRRMSRAKLFQLWPLKYAADEWTIISMSLAPRQLVAPPEETGFSRADYAQHIMDLKERLAKKGLTGFNIRIEEPFVVIGDDDPDTLARRAQTVRWAADHLEKDFFDKRPTKILDVYLFKDEASYERGVARFTSSPPDTPYGFYSSTLGGLFMNISTGGGTLVHEIVHPYVEADFPDAPAWLNEGLGSLFEQSAERGGRIVGLPNWRLAGLKKAIKKKKLPSFKALAAMSDHAFYEQDRGDNYAQARYLFYWMQERGLLVPFYEAFRKNREKDPTGYATLVATLGESDMTAFQKSWEEYVMTLQYP